MSASGKRKYPQRFFLLHTPPRNDVWQENIKPAVIIQPPRIYRTVLKDCATNKIRFFPKRQKLSSIDLFCKKDYSIFGGFSKLVHTPNLPI